MLAAISSGYNNVKLWNAKTGKPLPTWELDFQPYFVSINPTSTRVLAYPFSGVPKVWDLMKGKELTDLPIQEIIPYSAVFALTGSHVAPIEPTASIWQQAPVGQELIQVVNRKL